MGRSAPKSFTTGNAASLLVSAETALERASDRSRPLRVLGHPAVSRAAAVRSLVTSDGFLDRALGGADDDPCGVSRRWARRAPPPINASPREPRDRRSAPTFSIPLAEATSGAGTRPSDRRSRARATRMAPPRTARTPPNPGTSQREVGRPHGGPWTVARPVTCARRRSQPTRRGSSPAFAPPPTGLPARAQVLSGDFSLEREKRTRERRNSPNGACAAASAL
jgi:hypothetical protein